MNQLLNTQAAKEMVDGDISLYRILLESYLNDKKLEEQKLIELESKEDTTEAAKYVHYFKGAARQLGAEILAQAGQELEDVLRKKTQGDIDALNSMFFKTYRETVEAMHQELDSLDNK